VVSCPSVAPLVVVGYFNDERLRRKEQALCAAYLSLKNRELQFVKDITTNTDDALITCTMGAFPFSRLKGIQLL
jgi:hypothetical protein